MKQDKLREKIKAEYARFNHQLIAITARVNATGEFAELEQAEEAFYSKILALFDEEEIRKQERERIRVSFLKRLTFDSKTHDARRKEFNQAIFDAEKGWAVFNGTSLDMVMSKFDEALKEEK